MSETIINFGKHKGSTISECPIEYLDWLLGQDWLFEDLANDIKEYLKGSAEYQRM